MVTLDIHLTGDLKSGDDRVWFGGRLGEKGMCKFRNGQESHVMKCGLGGDVPIAQFTQMTIASLIHPSTSWDPPSDGDETNCIGKLLKECI